MELPRELVDEIRKGMAVLVLGAGASRGARDEMGREPPDGRQLARYIAGKFLSGRHADSALSAVSELSISAAGGPGKVQEYLRDLLERFRPADFHLLLPTFRWFGLATTNFDLIVEQAYDLQPARAQRLVRLISNHDRIDDLMRSLESVCLIKLHGCNHLKHAFTSGDNNYEAQFWYAVYLFVRNRDSDRVESRAIFRGLRNARLPQDFRSKIRYVVSEDGRPRVFEGTLRRKEGTYGFLEESLTQTWIFVGLDEVGEDRWTGLAMNQRVRFQIGFNLFGPTALNVETMQ